MDDRVVVVTGGSRGIGRAMAEALAKQGASVEICGRDAEALDEVSKDWDKINASVVDLCDEQVVESWVEAIGQRHGRIDGLVNNAGTLGPRAALDETDVEAFRRTLEINATGSFMVLREAYRWLRASAQPVVINMSSSVGRRGRGQWGAYSISKFAVEGLAEVAADELADDGGCVVTLNPGGTATGMRAEAYPDEDPATLPTPAKVADTVVLLLTGLGPDENGQKYSSRSLFNVLEQWPSGAAIPSD